MGGLRALIDAPVMALTASAPPAVQAEIISSLYLISPVIVSGDLNRKNIFFSASPIKSLDVGTMTGVILLVNSLIWQGDLSGIAEMLKSPAFIIPKSIVYVQTKDMAWKVYSYLQRVCARHSYVGVYHASLTQATKAHIYQEFRSGGSTLRCLIATVAFGMVCTGLYLIA